MFRLRSLCYWQLIYTHILLQNCLWGASGMDATNEYQSMIVYHHNSPWWSETIRLAVPIDKFYGSHIRLEYRHCSSKYWCCGKCDRQEQCSTCNIYTKTPILHSLILRFPWFYTLLYDLSKMSVYMVFPRFCLIHWSQKSGKKTIAY
jgi:hypothetical protein